jgi:hypothetical protein
MLQMSSTALLRAPLPQRDPNTHAHVCAKENTMNMSKMGATEKNASLEVNSPVNAAKPIPDDIVDPDTRADVEDLGHKKSPVFTCKDKLKRNAQKRFCPHGITTPLLLVLIASALTSAGSWACSYFTGATTGFTGNNYGLWTLEDKYGECNPWEIIFSSYRLDNYLTTARVLSMAAMVLGLSLLTTMSQALQCYLISWGVGVAFLVIFIVSLMGSQMFNLWAFFLLLLYVVLVLTVRSFFIHPVRRRISVRGSNCIACLLILNFVLTSLTLLVLNSVFCQCSHLTSEQLERRLDPSLDPCDNRCELGPAGITVIFGAATWLLAGLSVFKCGVQTEDIETETDEPEMYANDRDRSLTGPTQSFSSLVEEAGELPAELADSLKRLEEEEEEEDQFRRTHCQKLCCDFRRTERTRQEKTVFWCFRFILVVLYAAFGLSFVALVGSRYENGVSERCPSTTANFVTNVTCAFNASDPSSPFVTYMRPEAAAADNMTVAHCGPCAFCSNMEDIKTYVTTKDIMTKEAKYCAMPAVLGSTDELYECLEDRIGFTDDCRTCWVENMECDAKRCLFTCLITLLTGCSSQNTVPQAGYMGELNACLRCDEKRCGTAFVTCSGSARRRLGIQSDIERNPNEVCPHVETDWLSYPFK